MIATKSRLKVCDKHGQYEAQVHEIFGRQLTSGCPKCSEERAEAERIEKLARERAAEIARQQQMLADAAIPLRFQERTFDNYRAETKEQLHALTVARDFAESFDPRSGRGLVLAGKPGTGKSHLAAAILLRLMDRHSVRYTTMAQMVRAIRNTWRRDSEHSETEVLRYLGEELDLLVVDEVGVQYGTEGEQNVIFDVLDLRYRQMRPTILMTNQDAAGFKGYVGDRVFDRLKETSKWVPFAWESFRGQK